MWGADSPAEKKALSSFLVCTNERHMSGSTGLHGDDVDAIRRQDGKLTNEMWAVQQEELIDLVIAF